jgi:tetratricopeptide (TPR) repeat protein
MWRERELSREQVQRAARDPDPEVAGRAKWVLRQWRRGAVPGMPPKISRLLQSDDPAAIEELLEYGQFRAAVVAVEESGGSVDLETVRERISNALVRRFPVYVALAVQQDSVSELLRLVDLTATSREMAVCRIQLMQHLELPIDESSLLPTAADTWSESERLHATVLVLIVLGREDRAIERAETGGDEELVKLTRMLTGRWDEIALAAKQLAEAADQDSGEQRRYWSDVLIAADRWGNAEISKLAIEQLSKPPPPRDSLDRSLELQWQTLAIHGEVDAAVALLVNKSPDVAAEIALAAARTQRAVEALGYPLEELDSSLDAWIDEAIEAEQQKVDDSEENLSVGKLLLLMRVLVKIGRDDAAWKIASRLCQPKANQLGSELRDLTLYHLLMGARYEWVIKLAVLPGEKSISSSTERYLEYALPDFDAPTFKILMDATAYLLPSLDFHRRFRVVCSLVSGDLPTEFDEPYMFARLYDRLTTGKRQIQRVAGRVVVSPRMQLNKNLVALFSRHGQVELATRSLQELANAGNAAATLELAEGELNHGRLDKATEYFELLWRQVQGSGAANRNLSADATFAAKALVGQWIIAMRQGDQEQLEQRRRQLNLTLCSPSTEMRSEVAEYLANWGRTELATEVFAVLLPMSALGSQGGSELIDVARSFAARLRTQVPDQAARWFDLGVLRILESGYNKRVFVTWSLYAQRLAVDAAIQNKHESVARQHIYRVLKLNPMDIDFAERQLPEAREAGWGTLADETLDQIIRNGKSHLQRFPFDATVANNLAWVAAKNSRHLDEALAMSQRAVYLEPDSAIYRDTLAEVLFLLGHVDQALHIERWCVLDDPDQWHLHEQIKKYRAALAEQ